MNNSCDKPVSIRDSYRHCIHCGSNVVGAANDSACKCANCGYVFHFNPIVAVGVIIKIEDKVLLIRRNRDPGKGKLGLPGGFVDIGETAEDAAIREAHEEIGVNVNELCYVATFPNSYVYQNVVVPVLDIFYSCRVADGKQITMAAEEVSEVVYRQIDEETLAQMAFTSNRRALEVFAQR